MLKPEEFKEELNQILENVNDPGKVSQILTKLHENYNSMVGEYEEISSTNAKLKESNESLVKSNGELFRYVGLVKEEPEQTEPDKEEPKPDLPPIEDVMENLLKTWGEK